MVESGQASLHDAADLWGLTVNETVDRLESRFGSDIHTAVIGPAGEARVRFASVVTDRTHQAARMGMGAVAGSKRLKAIVIRGDARPPVADPARCEAITRDYAERMRTNPLATWQLDPPGFAAWVHLLGDETALCARNYRDSAFAAADAYDGEHFMAAYAGEAPCPGCPNNCIKRFAPARGEGVDSRAGGIHQEITGAMGPNLGVTDLQAVLQANVRCNELGLDPTSLGFTLSMAMECAETGSAPASLLPELPRFGDGPAVLATMDHIAHRDGIGDLLAEGAFRAAAHLGTDAGRYAMHVKGLEMVPFEPRSQTNLALGYATAPVGPRYDICEHDWDYDVNAGWSHTLEGSRTLGIFERVPMGELSARKVRNFKALNTIWSAADVLDFCIFAIAPTRPLALEQMAELLAAVTGWETSSHEVMRFGERRNHLMRVYNLREGVTAADDTLPARFFDDPIPTGAHAGERLDRDAFAESIHTYYRIMGWNDAGEPRYETLLDHHLEWVVADGHARRV
jgi:aldehyde:ferredoxin oxidoreductase